MASGPVGRLPSMFYLTYMVAELRRRKGRTLLTALGLGVGVGLVVTVSALSAGLDDAQDEVLEPLTGVGTDMSVTRPLNAPRRQLSELRARAARRTENGGARLGLRDLGEPGEKFTRTSFVAASQLSFPASEVGNDRGPGRRQRRGRQPDAQRGDGLRDGAEGAAAARSGPAGRWRGARPGPAQHRLQVLQRHRRRPDQAGDRRRSRPQQITKGRYLSSDPDSREAVLNVSYARRNGLTVGETIKLGGKTYTVVGLAPVAARRPELRRLREVGAIAGALRPQGPREHGAGARGLRRRRRGGAEGDPEPCSPAPP